MRSILKLPPPKIPSLLEEIELGVGVGAIEDQTDVLDILDDDDDDVDGDVGSVDSNAPDR